MFESTEIKARWTQRLFWVSAATLQPCTSGYAACQRCPSHAQHQHFHRKEAQSHDPQPHRLWAIGAKVCGNSSHQRNWDAHSGVSHCKKDWSAGACPEKGEELGMGLKHKSGEEQLKELGLFRRKGCSDGTFSWSTTPWQEGAAMWESLTSLMLQEIGQEETYSNCTREV